jgi:predicted HicB family RNase H-like nuclease
MQMSNHIRAIQSDLAAAAALGDEASVEAGRRLAEALESSLHLRLLDVLTEAALGLSGSMPVGHVEVRLAGRDPELVYVVDYSEEQEPAPGDDLSARITLRLPEALKGRVEAAAAQEGVSTNAWIVRALARALDPRSHRSIRIGNRLQGFAQS